MGNPIRAALAAAVLTLGGGIAVVANSLDNAARYADDPIEIASRKVKPFNPQRSIKVPAAVKDLIGQLDAKDAKDLSEVVCNLKDPSVVRPLYGEDKLRALVARLEEALGDANVKAYCDWAHPPST